MAISVSPDLPGLGPDLDRLREAAARLADQLARHDAFETELQHVGVSPHAPYTVSDPLFALVARSGRRIAVHIAESDAEQRFVCEGAGPFADAHRARGFPARGDCGRDNSGREEMAK